MSSKKTVQTEVFNGHGIRRRCKDSPWGGIFWLNLVELEQFSEWFMFPARATFCSGAKGFIDQGRQLYWNILVEIGQFTE